MKIDMIAMQNIIDKDNVLLTVIFDKSVLKHLRCKVNDYLVIMQSRFNHRYFILIKSDNGYRIKKYANMKKVYQISVKYKFEFIPEFDWQECIYFLKANNIVRIKVSL